MSWAIHIIVRIESADPQTQLAAILHSTARTIIYPVVYVDLRVLKIEPVGQKNTIDSVYRNKNIPKCHGLTRTKILAH